MRTARVLASCIFRVNLPAQVIVILQCNARVSDYLSIGQRCHINRQELAKQVARA